MLVYYMPFPLDVPFLKDVRKIIFFSYPSQSFGAYEYGNLVYAGPTNMGRKKDPTPEGFYHANWKAEKTTSTFDDEWELKWNFNVENKEGDWMASVCAARLSCFACLFAFAGRRCKIFIHLGRRVEAERHGQRCFERNAR